jgi:hypothetical protein
MKSNLEGIGKNNNKIGDLILRNVTTEFPYVERSIYKLFRPKRHLVSYYCVLSSRNIQKKRFFVGILQFKAKHRDHPTLCSTPKLTFLGSR